MYITQKRPVNMTISPAGYTETTLDQPISYYESDDGSGGTCQVIINTATKEKNMFLHMHMKITRHLIESVSFLKTWHR